MNSRNLLSTLLYFLIGLLLIVVGYKACQVRKEKEAALEESRRFDQQLRDMGYTGTSSVDTNTVGSAFVGDQSAPTYRDGAYEAPTTHSGIEHDQSSASAKPQITDEDGKKVYVSDLDSEMGMSDKPKYMVTTGSFRQLSNARREMETMVKKGFTEAEVGRFNRGTYAVAIALRTNSKNEANVTVNRLKKLGFKDVTIRERK